MKILAGISPIVFHATEINRAAKIMQANAFFLVNSNFSNTETKLTKPGYDYYFSTARNRKSGYIDTSNRQVIFTLDGRKLSQRYKGAAVDYWGADMRKVDRRYDEQEDRIYSKSPKITNALSYVKDISVLLKDFKPYYVHSLYSIIQSAEEHKIPVYVYDNLRDYVAGNKKKAESIQDLMERMGKFMSIPENKYTEYDNSDMDGYIEIMAYVDFINLLQACVKHELTTFDEAYKYHPVENDEQKKRVTWVRERLSYKSDFVGQLSNAFQNSRNYMTERTVEAAAELTKLMRKFKVNSFSELYEAALKLNQEWKAIDDRKRLQKATDKFWETIKESGFSFDIEFNKDDVLKYLKLHDFKYTKSGSIPEENWKTMLMALTRIDNIGFYDIYKIEILLNDANNEEEIIERLTALGFIKYSQDDYVMDKRDFNMNVYDSFMKKSTAASVKVLQTRN